MSNNQPKVLSGISGSASSTTMDALPIFPGELYVKDAHKSFGVTKALNGCSFSANFGEIHAIVGGNGCGKSTLAKVLSGVLPLDSGKVSILGHHPSSPSESKSVGIATVFQEVMIADEASVVDNLFTGVDGFWTRSMPNSEKIIKAQTLMRELADEDIDVLMPAGELPLSLKAWITIARALLTEPKVLILDESSAALDFDSTERLFNKMRELRDKGAAILIVTHRIAELIRISDRATVMRDGKDVGVLARSEITEENLLSLMTGRANAGKKSAEAANKATSQEATLRTRQLKVWDNCDPVDFGLLKGEIVGITGLDGHGQDDFVRILAGVAQATLGYPEVKDKNNEYVALKSLDEAKAQGISFVSGDRKREGILTNLSIFENLLIPLYKTNTHVPGVRFIDWMSLSDIFDWEVERLSIKTGPKSNLITSLSGGNQQKIVIGRSFALHPKILVLNDPARGIDVDTKGDLYKHLREFADEGNAVIYMSSELEEFIGFCSRVLVFRNGSIFDTFIDEDVEPVGILESMFGRVRNQSSRKFNETSDANLDAENMTSEAVHQSKSKVDDELDSKVRKGADIRHIKIVEFDEKDQRLMDDRDKIKVSYFE
ncbi:MAG: ribose transport system ATP-binding protein [Gammaproteobacteria bacterium]|jgi:ribose transport system ATP-binding protein